MGIIELKHGGGGKATSELISMFSRYFSNEILNGMEDAALLKINGDIAFTTDSFVIKPYKFPGGDIGKLSVCGTINDLVARGAKPAFLSAAFIIEEGFSVEDLEGIVSSMADSAGAAGIKIVTGDTKVVERGHADGIYINTAGIGNIAISGVSAHNVRSGDKVIITGGIGEHGAAILSVREGISFNTDINSDCADLSPFIEILSPFAGKIHAMRDATRGGLAAVLNEIAAASGVDVKIHEEDIPVKDEVAGLCDVLGLDPMVLANEGKLVIFVDSDVSDKVLDAVKSIPLGADAAMIGEATAGDGMVIMDTVYSTERIIDMPYGELLPRIC